MSDESKPIEEPPIESKPQEEQDTEKESLTNSEESKKRAVEP